MQKQGITSDAIHRVMTQPCPTLRQNEPIKNPSRTNHETKLSLQSSDSTLRPQPLGLAGRPVGRYSLPPHQTVLSHRFGRTRNGRLVVHAGSSPSPHLVDPAIATGGPHFHAWCALGRAQSDVLYAATVLQGLHLRLHRFVYGKADVADVLFTLVHPALRQLDDDAPLTARWLRELMGWGNWDESDPDYLQQMKHALQRTLQRVMGQGGGLPSSISQMPTNLLTSLAVQRGH